MLQSQTSPPQSPRYPDSKAGRRHHRKRTDRDHWPRRGKCHHRFRFHHHSPPHRHERSHRHKWLFYNYSGRRQYRRHCHRHTLPPLLAERHRHNSRSPAGNRRCNNLQTPYSRHHTLQTQGTARGLHKCNLPRNHHSLSHNFHKRLCIRHHTLHSPERYRRRNFQLRESSPTSNNRPPGCCRHHTPHRPRCSPVRHHKLQTTRYNPRRNNHHWRCCHRHRVRRYPPRNRHRRLVYTNFDKRRHQCQS